MKYPNANEYYHLTCNKKHEYTFYFTNGFVVKTKDNILMRRVVKGEMSFNQFIRDFAHLIIDWPDRQNKHRRFENLKEVQKFESCESIVSKCPEVRS